MTIVGVVGTVKQYGLDVDGRIVVYRRPRAAGYQVARTSGDPRRSRAAIVRAIHEIDPTIPVYDVRTMQDRMSDSMARQRFSTIMLGAFAVFALILAVVGVYGVMSYLVSAGHARHRRADGARRPAQPHRGDGHAAGHGADRRRDRRRPDRRGGADPGDGDAAVRRQRHDLVTFATVPLCSVAIALLATYLPALRATRVDPVVALREE